MATPENHSPGGRASEQELRTKLRETRQRLHKLRDGLERKNTRIERQQQNLEAANKRLANAEEQIAGLRMALAQARGTELSSLRRAREHIEKQDKRMADQKRQIEWSAEKAIEKNKRLERYREMLQEERRESEGLRWKLSGSDAAAKTRTIQPENLIWMFGYGRTGSTWLSYMMGELEGHAVWFEPYVGSLFGDFYYTQAWEGQLKNKHFILGSQKESWLNPLRSFVLDVAETRFPEVTKEEYLVIKEPHGSIGAPLLLEALPESRVVLLVRDPRDVISSGLDAYKKGSWANERMDAGQQQDTRLATEQPDVFVEVKSKKFLQHMNNAVRAYEDHEGPKTLVRYEDLRADTLGVMQRMYSDLGVSVAEEELGRAIEKHSWENIPEVEKGEGKFYRKASLGGWEEDLTGAQTETVNRITEPIIRQFYSDP